VADAFDMVMDPNYIGATDADQGGLGSTWGKLKSGMVGKILHDLYTLPERAGQVAYDYGQTGQYNPAPIMEAAMTATTGGMPLAQAGALGSAGGKGIRAYHGSPHDFDKFDLSKIGTGEGAQAYGHGLYFAENEKVARQYRDDLSNAITANGQRLVVNNRRTGSTGNSSVDDMLLAHNGDVEAAIADLTKHMRGLTPTQLARAGHGPELAALEALRGKVGVTNPGKMYEVNINAHPDQFLDWDKPLMNQPSVVQDLARNADLSHLKPGNRTRVMLEKFKAGEEQPTYLATGHTLHNALEDYGMKPRPELSQYLNSQGIPGIKYLDQGSRTAGQGTSNYVVFDDKLIDILKKYGIAGPLGALMAQGNETQQ
jgi:hypothetical protein